MNSRELSHWLALYCEGPFGTERLDWCFGMLAATFANAHRKKGSRAFHPKDFMLRKGKQRQKSPDELYAVFNAFVNFHNAREKKKKG